MLKMERLPENRFTERLTNIYDELHLDSEKRFLADIVVSNLIELGIEESYSFYDCGYGIESFYDRLDMLSQSDDFMKLLYESKSIHMYEMFKQILDKKTGIKYDILDKLFSIIPLDKSEPILKEDVTLTLGVDEKIEELGQIESWYKYLYKIGLYEDYETLKNSEALV